MPEKARVLLSGKLALDWRKVPSRDNLYSTLLLYVMIPYAAARFFAVSSKLTGLIKVIERSPTQNVRIKINDQTSFRKTLEKIEADCGPLSLDSAINEIQRTKKMLSSGTYMDFARRLGTLYERIYDQTHGRLFFYIPNERKSWYEYPQREFGLKACAEFADCLTDIEEAGKCYATGRWTASVFHLMRIMEAGLHVMCEKARPYGITFPEVEHNRSWDAWLRPLEKQLSKTTEHKSAEWRKVEDSYAEFAADLRNVSRAWRNRTMHIGINYDQEHTLKIYLAVKSFMGDLAGKLK